MTMPWDFPVVRPCRHDAYPWHDVFWGIRWHGHRAVARSPAHAGGPTASAVASILMFLTHLLVTAVALGVASYILPGVHITSWVALIVAALVLGFVNTIVRPVLVFVTFPITILTLGLFYLVVNGIAFGLAAAVVPGFDIDSFGWAILGALVTGIGSWFVGALVKQ